MRRIEFAELRGDPALGGNTVRLFGRVYHGPIRIGDIFTEVKSGRGMEDVGMRVMALVFKGDPVPELVTGQTAELVLTGLGVERVTPGARINGKMF
ncbi:hypothetical protein ACFQ1S_20725 [Kibdelosporangium lantanae]|jgi:hypothetical protein|uniref:Translation elongation factor EFTu-like domain-containing protein n=1 Tax=Kibdelosporangium lantanae TaxID=1497396 RepID=A0ABW3MFH4_9PSEU